MSVQDERVKLIASSPIKVTYESLVNFSRISKVAIENVRSAKKKENIGGYLIAFACRELIKKST